MARDDEAKKAAKRRAKRVEKAQRKHAKEMARRKKGKHKHDDHGKTYVKKIWGTPYLITPCSKCGKVMSRDNLNRYK